MLNRMLRKYQAFRQECRPKQQVEGGVDKVDFRALAALGKKHLLLDLDNCVTSPHTDEVVPEVAEALRRARQEGHVSSVCLVTNIVVRWPPRIKRARRIAKQLDAKLVCCCWPNAKPKPTPFRKALLALNATSESAYMVGDQLFTDIRGANMVGIYSVLVKPLGPDHFTTLPKRWGEGHFFRQFASEDVNPLM